ncbi:hypothetical protein Tco_0628491, partial [Tanacetum coccineum]
NGYSLMDKNEAKTDKTEHGNGNSPKFCSHLRKGNVSEIKLLCCVPDTAYGSCPIRRISEKSALAVEIDLTWSRGFIFVLIEARWFLIAASVEARISLIMLKFSSCLLVDSAMNLVSDSSKLGLRSGYEEFPLFRW